MHFRYFQYCRAALQAGTGFVFFKVLPLLISLASSLHVQASSTSRPHCRPQSRMLYAAEVGLEGGLQSTAGHQHTTSSGLGSQGLTSTVGKLCLRNLTLSVQRVPCTNESDLPVEAATDVKSDHARGGWQRQASPEMQARRRGAPVSCWWQQ